MAAVLRVFAASREKSKDRQDRNPRPEDLDAAAEVLRKAMLEG